LLKSSDINTLNRIFDANINRLKEGLRVCEELARFMLNSGALTKRFKKLRHELDTLAKKICSSKDLLSVRDSLEDVGRKIHAGELKRKGFGDIFFANIQRAKESARGLEEFAKLVDPKLALKFKKLRYELYEVEKSSAKKINDAIRLR